MNSQTLVAGQPVTPCTPSARHAVVPTGPTKAWLTECPLLSISLHPEHSGPFPSPGTVRTTSMSHDCPLEEGGRHKHAAAAVASIWAPDVICQTRTPAAPGGPEPDTIAKNGDPPATILPDRRLSNSV